MRELIDRQAAIEAVEKFIPADPMKNDYTQGISVGLAIATRCIEEFSQETDESSQGLVKDIISRQAAIDAVIKRDANCGIDSAEVLRTLPSVQPRKGKWHGKGDSEGFGIFICDNCGKFAMMEYDFCPNCGCCMKEGDSE